MRRIVAILEWIGARARWFLAIGVIIAMFLPELSRLLRPALPALVALVFCLAMIRLDLGAVARRAVRPRRLAVLLAASLGLLVLVPAGLWLVAQALGLPQGHAAALVYTGAAPPITSAVAMCLMLGLDAALALEVMVLATLITPIVGPVVTKMLLGEAVPIDGFGLAFRLAAMIAAGGAAALAIRRWAGPARIARAAKPLDGLSAIALVIFIIPLFDGFWEAAGPAPLFALGVLALAVTANFGLQIVAVLGLRNATAPDRAGAIGLMNGNRTVALYLAALPPDPVFTLYVAFYQIPMLYTPLVMGRLLAGRRGGLEN